MLQLTTEGARKKKRTEGRKEDLKKEREREQEKKNCMGAGELRMAGIEALGNRIAYAKVLR